MSSFFYSLTVKFMVMLSLLGPEQLNVALDPLQLQKAEQVDVASVGGRYSYAEYRPDRSPPQLPAGYPVHSFTPVPAPFGRFVLRDGVMIKGGSHCGYIVPLGPGAGSMNLLGYRQVTLKGEFRGTWRVALADDTLALREDNVPLGRIRGSGTHSFDLGGVLRRMDLSRARHLVLLLESGRGAASLEAVSFTHPQREGGARECGIWIWRRDSVLGREEKLLGQLTAQGVKRVYLQVGDDPEVFAPFLSGAARAGVEVYALDGSPGYIAAPQELLARLERVERYNAAHRGARFAGVQLDIEPYLNRDFASRKAYYASAYAELLAGIRRRFSLPLSVAVPFWFDTVTADGSSLLQRIFENAEEVVVMSYRTDPGQLLEISRSALSLGEQLGIPVRLGVELGPIPDEQHQVFNRCSEGGEGAFKIGSSWWCPGGDYLVPGTRISFNQRMAQLPVFLKTAVPFTSFRGWVLHSYEEMPLAHE